MKDVDAGVYFDAPEPEELRPRDDTGSGLRPRGEHPHGIDGMLLRPHALDGALLFFDRTSGTNVLLEAPALRGSVRRAPRVLHVGLTNRCNLRCSFCFRDRGLESAWTADEVLAWARAFADAGALEIAFGQGEPLLFQGFPALVRALHRGTPLAVNFTTNGLRLGPALLSELDDAYGQIRLSWYADNEPLARARMLADRRARFGVNLLVTPAVLPALRATVEALADAGCRDVLLLSYNGVDPALHLDPEGDRALARTVLDLHGRYGQALTLKLSVCFGRRLFEVPTHPSSGDCGAGDDFITLDSEKRLLACSFHRDALPVGSAAEALYAYRLGRRRRAPAGLLGCARPGAVALGTRESPSGARVSAWQGWASNHSTSYVLVGELPSAAKAEAYIEEVRRYLDDPRTVPSFLSGGATSAMPPEVVLAGGRRVLVYDSDTLYSPPAFIVPLLFRRHGRLLWRADTQYHQMIFGVEAGERVDAVAAQLSLRNQLVAGSRIYGAAAFYDVRGVAKLIEGLPRSIAVLPMDDTDETLAEALARPAPLPPPKRRVEWLHVEDVGIDAMRESLALMRKDPAQIDRSAPFRLPARMEARRLLGGTIVRTEGAPIPGVLEDYLVGWRGRNVRILNREELRLRVHIHLDGYDDDDAVNRLSEGAISRLSKPGWSIKVRTGEATITLFPSDPFAAFSRITAAYNKLGRKIAVEISPPRPLADAVARIQADLDLADA